jgi:hypothetical protein
MLKLASKEVLQGIPIIGGVKTQQTGETWNVIQLFVDCAE